MLTQNTEGTVPIKYQIADAIRADIESGKLVPGDPLPTIDELSKAWRCAPGVAREAVDVLKGEGRVTGGRGKRAVVRIPPKRIRLTAELALEQKRLALRPRSERETNGAIEITAGIPIAQTDAKYVYETVAADTEMASEFGFEPGTTLQRRTFEMKDRETGNRVAYSESFIPLALIESNPALLDESNEPWPGGHQHQLYTVGIEVDRLVRSLIAVQPTPGDRQKWGMEPGVALLQVRSRSVDITGRVVEVSDAVYPADRTEVTFTEQLPRWPKGHATYDPTKE